MRVLVDTNLFISYLINPGANNLTAALLERVAAGDHTLIFPEALLDEIVRVGRREKFRKYFVEGALEQLIETIKTLGEELPILEGQIPALTRDPKDDYLLTYAVIGLADFLVTGDQDLLVMDPFEGVRICTIRAFVEGID